MWQEGWEEGQERDEWNRVAHGRMGMPHLYWHRVLCLVECSAVSILKFSIFEQEILHFHFVLSPINDIAAPGWEASKRSECLCVET